MVRAGRNDGPVDSRLQQGFRRALEGEAGFWVVHAVRDGCPDARGFYHGLMVAALQVGFVVAVVGAVLPVRIRRVVAVGRWFIVVVAVSVVCGLRGENCRLLMAGPAGGVMGG